jgi:predicted DNA-binding transcriptional regulator AlpA
MAECFQPKGYLNPREAAQHLNSSPSTLAKLRLYGGGPRFTRIGRAVRYRRIDLDDFMEKNLVSSTSEKTGQ